MPDRLVFKLASAFCVSMSLFAGAAQAADAQLSPELEQIYEAAAKVIPGLPKDLVAQAAEEKSLMLYRVGYDFKAAMFPEFQKLFPFIQISDVNATVGELMQRYTAEATAGRQGADVVMSSLPVQVEALDKQGLVGHYTPTSANAFDGGLKADVYYPMSRVSLCNAYNSDQVSPEDAEKLKTWDGIFDPRWKGKAGIVRFGTGGVAILPYYYLDKTGKPFSDVLVNQQPLVFNSIPAMIERLAAGGLDVVFFANAGNLAQTYSKGAPIRWVCPDPGLSVYNFQFLAAKAPHPAAARLWEEFTLSKDGQQLVMQSLGLEPARKDVADDRPVAKEAWYKPATSQFAYSWSDIGAVQADLQAKWDAAAANIAAGD